MKANPTRTKARISPARFAPIRRRAASGGPAAADVAADAAGAADRRMVWPDRSPTNSGRHRRRKRPARLPISTAIRREPASLPAVQPEPVAPPPEQQPADHAAADQSRPRAGSVHPAETETAQEAERAARRRSTVREKVSFLVNAQPEAARARQPQPARAVGALPRPSLQPAAPPRTTPSPAAPDGGRAASATANKQPRFLKQKNRPAKPGGFFTYSTADGPTQPGGDRGLHVRYGSICLLRLACSLS